MTYECADFFMTRVAVGRAERKNFSREEFLEHCRQNPVFLEGVAIASPTLYQAFKSGKTDEKTYLSLLKYYLRCSSRATPFGTFSFVWMGEFSDRTALQFDPRLVKKRVRPDTEWASKMAKSQEVQRLRVMVNPSAVKKRGKLHLERVNSQTISIRNTPVVERICRLAKEPLLYEKLEAELLLTFKGEDEQKVKRCLAQVFQEGYLISELSPCINKPPVVCDPLLLEYQAKPLGEGLPPPDLQVDSYYAENRANLPCHIKERLEEAAFILTLQSGLKARLGEYHKQFLEKYGTTRLVPLPEAPPRVSTAHQKADPPYFGQKEIVLDEWVKRQKATPEKLPLSLELFFEIIADSQEAIDRGDYTLVINPAMATQQAGSAFGRFLYLWDEKSQLRELLKKEEALLPGVAFVEATFNPVSPRTANVCFTETMRDHTLQFHFREEGTSLAVDDIYVGATDEHLYLYSKTLAKEIRVVLSTAVNPELAPPVLKWLLEISNHRFTPFSPCIFEQFADAVHLPRVRFKNTILSPARWRFSKENLLETMNSYDVPPWVYLMDGDNRLLLNWKEPSEFRLLSEKKEITLMECVGVPALGGHVTEFVAPLIKNTPHAATLIPPIDSVKMLDRIKMPGCSEWLYAKISLPADSEREFIVSHLTPFINSLNVDKWFYVRYAEEGPQFRLRLHNANALPELSAWCGHLMQRELIHGFSFECYEREVERYGGLELIELAESVFCADSVDCVHQLAHCRIKLECQAALNILSIVNCFDAPEFLSPKHQDLLSGYRQELKQLSQYQEKTLDTTHLKIYAERIPDSDKISILDSLVHMHCNRLLGIDPTAEKRARAIAYYLQKRVFSEIP